MNIKYMPNLPLLIKDELETRFPNLTGLFKITLKSSTYDAQGGFRPYELIVQKTLTKASIIEWKEWAIYSDKDGPKVSNSMNYQSQTAEFEYIGKLDAWELKGDIKETSTFFLGNVSTYFGAGCYDSVEMESIS